MKLADNSEGIPLADRAPTPKEIERIRLLLSIFQDGSGTLDGDNGSLPDWRDFENVIDAFFEVTTPVDKDIFDVVVPYPPGGSGIKFGVSCKMRKELKKAYKKPTSGTKHGRAHIELSNPAQKVKQALNDAGITLNNYGEGNNPDIAGKALINLVKSWHEEVSVENGGTILLDKSCYLSLLWDDSGEKCRYRMYGFEHDLPDPTSLDWYSPENSVHIKGCESNGGVVFEAYPESGGQMKYYPRIENALWMSDEFELAPIPDNIDTELGAKAKAYFEERWEYTFHQ